jgi:hypothetical protein
MITKALEAKGAQPPSEGAAICQPETSIGGTRRHQPVLCPGPEPGSEPTPGSVHVGTGRRYVSGSVTTGGNSVRRSPATGADRRQRSGSSPRDGWGQPSQAGPLDDGLDVGDVLSTLLPAGLAFLQAKQTGADTASPIGQASSGALMGGQMNPLQSSTPRGAAGSLIAQSILQALASRR